MEIQNFDETLNQKTEPEDPELKHQNMLANAIAIAKDKSVVSWWWLCVPLYIIAVLLMKCVFIPRTTFIINIDTFISKDRFASVLFLLIVPILIIAINFISIRKIHFLSGSPKVITFLLTVWYNVLMIILSLFILIIYAL